MVDLSPYIPVGKPISDLLRETSNGLDDPRSGFLDELAAAGFKVPRTLAIGKLERIDAPGDTRKQATGWYVYNEFPDTRDTARTMGVGVYGSWRGTPEKVTWVSKATGSMSDDERVNYNHQLEIARQQREIEQRQMHAAAAQEVAELLANTEPATSDHPYLKRKGVPALGQCRISRGALALPLLTAEGQVASCQFIQPDGTKRFKTGGRKRGCFFPILGDDATVYIVEGYATGASVHVATGALVYVAFDAGNLYEVATTVRTLHTSSRLVIAADDDQFSVGNAGRTKAMQAAEAIGGECAFPTFTPDQLAGKPTDWNDLHALAGLAEVKRQLKGLPAVYKPTTQQDSDLPPPPAGVLRDLVDYYNATSGNHQPLFAVQTALAITSVVLARNFTTNLGNRTMLFLLNLGKSATGKEHAKRTLEKVLEACGEGQLIGPDGYTAGSAVFSALTERPRHVTVIDEFSKYIHAAQFKNGNSHLMEANSQMMQVFGRADGTLRPKSYSTMGLAKEKRAEMSGMKVTAPSITLLAMSTPDDLFEKLEFASVKDGFLNRFLVATSDAPRAVRRHKEPLPVPQRVLDWCSSIALRRGTEPDSATDEPRLHTLVFAQDATAMQEAFQLECITMAEKLERFGLAEVPMRANEIAMRIALIHALSRDPASEYVLAEDMAWAISWVRHNSNDLVRRLKMTISGSEFEGMKKAALLAIRTAGEAGITTARMQVDKPFSTYREKDLKEVLKALEEADLVYKDASKNGKRGRPVTVYYATGE
jgi:phage/plasmid primase-like uncharacterized protein